MVSSEHITGESLPVLRRVGDEVGAEWAREQHRELLD
jgi:cation transport ATPase